MRKLLLPSQLNVCLVARKFPLGGTGSEYGFLWPIARGLSLRGHSVIVLTADRSPTNESEMERDGVRIFYLSPENPRALQRFSFPRAARLKFVQLHREKPFHILHSIDSSGLDIAKFKKDFRVAIAFDVKATQLSQLFAIIGMAQETLSSLLNTGFALAYKYLRTYFGGDRALLNTADGVFVMSPGERTMLERYYYYPDARIHTLPYGIDIGNLTPREDTVELRKQLGLQEESHCVVCVTDMTEVGEMRNLFRAFEKAVIKKPDARLIVIGNGPQRKAIEFEMYSLALGNKVILTGALPPQNISDYLAVSDVFVNISPRSTGFEPAMLEAMAQKKLIITSEVGVAASIIEDGVDGFLVRPADIVTLSNLFLEIFTGHVTTFEMGERARKKVIDLFDIQNMIDQTVKAYFKILRRTGYYRKI